MFNFFVDDNSLMENGYEIIGSDYNHIKNVLRMKKGEQLLVSCNGQSDLCFIEDIDEEKITVSILTKNYKNCELPVEIYLFQGLPKSDKMELIIQKTVELGVTKIFPVEMKRCVVKLDDKKKNSKISRWQSIAESAAKQSKRNIIPKICNVLSFADMLNVAKDLDLFIVPYESKEGMKSTEKTFNKIKSGMKIGILIGSEGGFDENEITKVSDMGAEIISLGNRILRTETAAITTVSAVMLYSELYIGGEDE